LIVKVDFKCIRCYYFNQGDFVYCFCTINDKGKLEIHWFESERINTKNTHGTGCTLSSAIAAYLARGFKIKDAVRKAKKFIDKAINEGANYQLGKGNGPVHHFYGFGKEKY